MSKKDQPEALTKQFKAQTGTVDDDGGTIRAVASVEGVMDSYGDVIMPGFFTEEVLQDFLQNGWIDTGHDWMMFKNPIGYPVEAVMQGRTFVSAGKFHSTQEAQDIRTIVKERVEAGLNFDVSIGFYPDYRGGVMEFASGQELWDWAEKTGVDMSGMDPAIKSHARYCRALTLCRKLAEWSVVPIGAHPRAKGLDVKQFGADAPEESPDGDAIAKEEPGEADLAATQTAKARAEYLRLCASRQENK